MISGNVATAVVGAFVAGLVIGATLPTMSTRATAAAPDEPLTRSVTLTTPAVTACFDQCVRSIPGSSDVITLSVSPGGLKGGGTAMPEGMTP